MSQFKAMKFRVHGPVQSQEIQEALFALGYEWNSGLTTHYSPTANSEYFLYTAEDGRISCSGYLQQYFNTVPAPECFLEDILPNQEKPPLGLRPRNIAAQERLNEIVQAMGRYAEASKPIPKEWIDELVSLQEELVK